jgi:hypothetical protein
MHAGASVKFQSVSSRLAYRFVRSPELRWFVQGSGFGRSPRRAVERLAPAIAGLVQMRSIRSGLIDPILGEGLGRRLGFRIVPVAASSARTVGRQRIKRRPSDESRGHATLSLLAPR